MKNVYFGRTSVAALFAASTDAGSGVNSSEPAGNDPVKDELGSADPIDNAPGNRQADFRKALKDFIRATTTSMKKARELSDMAMEHFIAHNDVVYFQRFTDEIKKHHNNYVRLEALVSWATTFAPLSFDKGKWTMDKPRAEEMGWAKDKDVIVLRDNKPVRYNEISFWDFAPEKKIEPLDAEALLKFILGKVNSKKLAERVSGNASAEATLMLLKNTLTPLKPVHIEQAKVAEAA